MGRAGALGLTAALPPSAPASFLPAPPPSTPASSLPPPPSVPSLTAQPKLATYQPQITRTTITSRRRRSHGLLCQPSRPSSSLCAPLPYAAPLSKPQEEEKATAEEKVDYMNLPCGVEVLDFPAGDGLPAILSHSLSSAFDFLLAPLVDPDYRPMPRVVLPVAVSDLVLSPSQWSSHIIGKISAWIDLDSEDKQLRLDSEVTLKQEITWASHLSLQACVLPPQRSSCANYARVVNHILQGLTNMQLWLRLPLEKYEPMDEDLDKVKNNNHMIIF